MNNIAKIIYNNQYGCSREEAIEYIGFSKESYPEWSSFSKKQEFINYEKEVLKKIQKNPNIKNKDLGRFLYELMNPNSKYLWDINPPGERIKFTGNVFYEFCLAQHEQDDYILIAYNINKYLKEVRIN